jgi:hypothetical protein
MDNQAQKSHEVKVVDNIPGAEYSNMMQINHNKEEFQLTFFNMLGNSGRVVSKIITNPAHFKRMILAMNDNLKKYETQFGEIKEAQLPEKEIGFNA